MISKTFESRKPVTENKNSTARPASAAANDRSVEAAGAYAIVAPAGTCHSYT